VVLVVVESGVGKEEQLLQVDVRLFMLKCNTVVQYSAEKEETRNSVSTL